MSNEDGSICVSVIMPVRDGEKFVGQAIESVLNQSFCGWELVIIDDASTDATQEICRRYIDNPQVSYIRSEVNLGVGGGRNLGIKRAVGKYIIFLDSDDELPNDSIETRVALMEEYDADMVSGGHYYVLETGLSEIRIPKEVRVHTAREFYGRTRYWETGKTIDLIYVWDKIFLRDVINDNKLLFNEKISLCEDAYFLCDYIKAIAQRNNRIVVTDAIIYTYKKREGSLSVRSDWKKIFLCKDFFNRLKEDMIKIGAFESEAKEGYYHGYVNKVIGFLYAFVEEESMTDEDMSEWTKILMDSELQYGLSIYQSKNIQEDQKIISVLQSGTIQDICAYIQTKRR